MHDNQDAKVDKLDRLEQSLFQLSEVINKHQEITRLSTKAANSTTMDGGGNETAIMDALEEGKYAEAARLFSSSSKVEGPKWGRTLVRRART